MAERKRTSNDYKRYISSRKRKNEQPHFNGVFFQAVISGIIVLASIGLSLGGSRTEDVRVKIKAAIAENISQESIEAFAQKGIDIIVGIKSSDNEDSEEQSVVNNETEKEKTENTKPKTTESLFSNDENTKK